MEGAEDCAWLQRLHVLGATTHRCGVVDLAQCSKNGGNVAQRLRIILPEAPERCSRARSMCSRLRAVARRSPKQPLERNRILLPLLVLAASRDQQ
jgi:hypothetical protein